MGMVPVGGANKSFYRALGANGEYLPDASTIASRVNSVTGDTSLNEQCDAVTQASGEGFIIPPGEEFEVRFTGWTDATCVIQRWNPFKGTPGWETIYTWGTNPSPLVAQVFKLKSPMPHRIGASAIGSDAATLACLVDFGQSDRRGF